MKYYVVWEGKTLGVFDDWELCKESIRGYPSAIYKAFRTLAEAEEAFEWDPAFYIGKTPEETERLKAEGVNTVIGEPSDNSICTGGFYNRKSNTLSYWGINPITNEIVFEKKNIKGGNNLLSRFLPIVHAHGHLKNCSMESVVYTRNKQVRFYIRNDWYQKLFVNLQTNSEAYTILQRAIIWLSNNDVKEKVLIWNDLHWGEMPGLFYEKNVNQ